MTLTIGGLRICLSVACLSECVCCSFVMGFELKIFGRNIPEALLMWQLISVRPINDARHAHGLSTGYSGDCLASPCKLPLQWKNILWRDTLTLCEYPIPYQTSCLFISILFTQWVTIHYYCCMSMCKFSQIWLQEPLELASVSFWCASSFSEHSLFSGAVR